MLSCGCAQRDISEEELPLDDSDVDEEEITFMAVLLDRGQLGVAIFNALTTTLRILQLDIGDAAELVEVCSRYSSSSVWLATERSLV